VEIILEEYETTSVSGRVVNTEGNPISGADIWLMRRDKESMGGVSSIATVTDGDGNFKIECLSSATNTWYHPNNTPKLYVD